MIRAVEAVGGFGMVVAKGERDAGTLLVICCEKGTNARLFERMPQAGGSRSWVLAKQEDPENKLDFLVPPSINAQYILWPVSAT